jgi:glycosyl transferase family 25
MAEIFAALGIDFERFDAVQAASVHLHPVYALLPPPRFQPWTTAQLATVLSHHNLWTRIAEGDEPFGAIFEDDIHVSPLVKEFLSSIYPSQIDILRFETYARFSTTYRTKPIEQRHGVGLHQLFKMHSGTAGYIVSKKAAAILVSRPQFLSGPVDNLLFEPQQPLSRGLHTYQCVPGLVVQDDAQPPELRRGGYLASNMPNGPPSQVIPRRLPERLSRFPRSGALRLERLLIPMTTGRIPFAGPLDSAGSGLARPA